jgi:chromate transporter
MTGYGLVQAVPGPVFSVSSFIGGMIMSTQGPFWQVMGCLVATAAVFLPSTLLLLFFFPIYQNLKNHVIIYRALEGINAVIVGIIWASAILLLMEINKTEFDWASIVTCLATFALLQFTKLPAPITVIACLVLGIVF